MQIALITYPMDTNPAGIGMAVRQFARNVIALDQRNTYHLLHFTPSTDPLYRGREILYPHYKHLPVMFSDSLYLRKNWRRFDIIHRFSPGGFIFKSNAKKIITVYDLFAYKTYRFNRRFRLGIYLARFFNKASLLRADAVIAGSHFTKQELLATFPLDARKIHVIHSAPGIALEHAPTAESRALLHTRYGIDKSYILFVSTIEPRKNLLGLVKAYEILRARHGIKASLVVVGKKGWDYHRTLAHIARSEYKSDIKLVGYVPGRHLVHFYRQAQLFVYPSFMEGFGIPPLEAMQYGCPTLTADTSSLPEVVRHPEMMFPPHDIEGMAAKCLRVLTDPGFRTENIRKGRQNVQRFSWQDSARRLIAIYQQL